MEDLESGVWVWGLNFFHPTFWRRHEWQRWGRGRSYFCRDRGRCIVEVSRVRVASKVTLRSYQTCKFPNPKLVASHLFIRTQLKLLNQPLEAPRIPHTWSFPRAIHVKPSQINIPQLPPRQETKSAKNTRQKQTRPMERSRRKEVTSHWKEWVLIPVHMRESGECDRKVVLQNFFEEKKKRIEVKSGRNRKQREKSYMREEEE